MVKIEVSGFTSLEEAKQDAASKPGADVFAAKKSGEPDLFMVAASSSTAATFLVKRLGYTIGKAERAPRKPIAPKSPLERAATAMSKLSKEEQKAVLAALKEQAKSAA